MNEANREWIDKASYYELLKRWRFSPAGGDEIFQGDTGKYYSKVMSEKRVEIGHDGAVRVSKQIGWERL